MFIVSRLSRLFQLALISASVFACSSTTRSESNVVSTDSRESESDQRPRYAGGEWSRKKILEYIRKHDLTFGLHGNYEYVVDQCRGAIEPLRKAKFSFIEPTVITDEWDDFRLEKYKKKYSQFKFGMGIAGNAGESNGSVPRWNINVYDVDIDLDGVDDTILYGEALELGTFTRTAHPASFPSGYLVFTEGKEIKRGVYLSNDPSGVFTGLILPIYSALILINGVYSVIDVEDYEIGSDKTFNLRLTFIGKQNFERGTSGSSFQCHYKLK